MPRTTKFPVPEVQGIDLDFRPASYWDVADPESAIVQNIKGQKRREMARDFISGSASDLLGPIDPELLRDSIDDGMRQRLGRIHPSFMGGEYLPDYAPGEAEIARIVLESTLGDVFSIRARRTRPESPFRYTLADEHGNAWTVSPKSSRHPLTLRQLIGLIDSGDSAEARMQDGLPLVESLITYGTEPLDVSFATLESTIYPELEPYYAERLAAWDRSMSDYDEDDQD